MGAAVAALFVMVGLPAQEARMPVQEAIAASAIAEAKGDLAGAATHLVKAWNGDPAELERVQASLSSLMQAISPEKQREVLDSLRRDVAHRNTEGVPDAAKIRELLQGKGFTRAESVRSSNLDPVQRLIAVLEEGTTETKVVYDAQRQLKELGALAVPPLLAALPKAGPFGFVNAMPVLEPHSDPRIAPALLERANADPAIAALVIEHSQRMSDTVREALVTGLDEAKLPAPARLQLADVMSSAPGTEQRRKAIALQLADEPSVQRELGAKVAKWNVPWASEVFTKLRAVKDPVAAASATAQWLLVQQDIDEATALAAIQPLDVRHRWWVARQVTERYSAWAKVALLGLGEGPGRDSLQGSSWFNKVEWWRGGGEAAMKLLEVTKTRPELGRHIDISMRRIIDTGWTAPPEVEATLASISLHALVAALPQDDDTRALAAWRRLESGERVVFVDEAVRLGRPWHRVVVAQLAAAQQFDDVRPPWIERDWNGVPQDAAAGLLALAQRFPKPPVGITGGLRATHTSMQFGPGQWLSALVSACARTPELPSSILTTLASAGDERAWRVLAQRDAAAALGLVRDPSRRWSDGLPQLLGEHGTAADVPTLVGFLEWHGLTDGELSQVRPFVERHCRGNLDVADRLQEQARFESTPTKAKLAAAIAGGVTVEQMKEVIERIPHLQPEVQAAAEAALKALVNATHAPVLAAELDAAFAREPFSDLQAGFVLTLMQKCAAPDCQPAVRRALASRRIGEDVMHAAMTAIAVAGPQRHAVLRELLGATDHRIVQVALDAEGVGQDQALMLAATNAMLAHGKQLHSVDKLFNSLDPATRSAQARAVLRFADFPQFHQQFCISVLQALGSLKDPAVVADLARGAQHADLNVRLAATEQLGRVFTREAAPFLLELLKDDDEGVRKLAKQGLDQLAEYLDARTKWDERLNRK